MKINLPILKNQYPYLSLKLFRFGKDSKIILRKIVFEKEKFTDNQKKIIKETKEYLIKNNIPVNKIKFTFKNTITYDKLKKLYNVSYSKYIPMYFDGTIATDKKDIIYPKNHENIIELNLNPYNSIMNNDIFLNLVLKNNLNKGIVIQLNEYEELKNTITIYLIELDLVF